MSSDWTAYYQKEHTIKRFIPEDDEYEAHRVKFVLSLLRSAGPFSTVLDAGCGDGTLCQTLQKSDASSWMVGLDVSLDRLIFAQGQGISTCLQGALPYLPLRDHCFDLVLLVEVLEHMVDPQRVLVELARISRRYVLVTVPFEQELSQVLCPHCLQIFYVDGHIQSFDEARLVGLCRESKLKVVASRTYRVPSMLEAGPALRFLPRSVKQVLVNGLVRLGLMKERKPKFLGVLCEVIG